MKRIPFFIALMCTSILIAGSDKKNEPPKNKFEPVARWTGTLSFEEKTTWKEGCVSVTSERHAKVNFTAALPTMYRDVETTDFDSFTDNKGTGSADYHSEGNTCGITGTTECTGTGVAELHAVTIREWDNTYDIEAIAPPCNGSNSDGTPYGPDVTDILVSNERLLDKDHLAGTKTVTGEVPGTTATVTRTTTWHLERVKEDDVELIVKPEETEAGYEKWMPEPGRNEQSKGPVMNIFLELRGKNGKPIREKVESFELTLSNTSTEPGMTINYPVTPDANQLPDLRFLYRPGIESIEADQSITVGSADGTTGKAWIASYDGGGWATLSVEAILKDNKRRIKGHLFVSGGDVDILIPKRVPGSKIALAWWKKNGNPDDMDDKETSIGNKNNGDGLTAYEEYRGVISQRKFRRLDPKEKEIGVDVIKDELPLFSEGIKWFENACNLTAVIFHEDLNEIGSDRRLNKNFHTNHDYDQYVLRLYKSVIPERLKNGKYQLNGTGIAGKAYGGPGIPAKVFAVVIDYNENVTAVRGWADYATKIKMPMPFTFNEYLANTVAHELGHGVNCWHHGRSTNSAGGDFQESDLVKIFSYDGTEITTRPYSAGGESKGNQQSGDLSCLMAYNPYGQWAYSWVGTTKYFYMVPILTIGKDMCISAAGTSINKADAGGNNHYFGNASKGKCLAQIKLRD